MYLTVPLIGICNYSVYHLYRHLLKKLLPVPPGGDADAGDAKTSSTTSGCTPRLRVFLVSFALLYSFGLSALSGLARSSSLRSICLTVKTRRASNVQAGPATPPTPLLVARRPSPPHSSPSPRSFPRASSPSLRPISSCTPASPTASRSLLTFLSRRTRLKVHRIPHACVCICAYLSSLTSLYIREYYIENKCCYIKYISVCLSYKNVDNFTILAILQSWKFYNFENFGNSIILVIL